MKISQIHRVYLLALLLLSNALMPMTAMADSNSKVLLCTSAGYKWVDLDAQNQSKAKQNSHCVLCLAADDSFDLAIYDQDSPGFLNATKIHSVWASTPISKTVQHWQSNPRAPPLFL